MLCQKSKVLVIIQKLTLMKTSADSLKKSADALNDSSLWEKKKIKKKDEKKGLERMKPEELYPYIEKNQPNICQISVLQNGQEP